MDTGLYNLIFIIYIFIFPFIFFAWSLFFSPNRIIVTYFSYVNPYRATIRFYGSLNDFLKIALRQKAFEVGFSGSPAVKDTIENCGVPHPEIDLILVNSQPVNFSYQIRDGDTVSAYPYMHTLRNSEYGLCHIHSTEDPDFIVDINLVKLGRYLRMVGFDTIMTGSQPDRQIARRASLENRILLSRDIDLLKHKIITKGYWVRNHLPFKQLAEVLRYFDITSKIKPFTRCLDCNGQLLMIEKNLILHRLEPLVGQYYNEFHICPDCAKIYWKGPHYERMMQFIHTLSMKV